MAKFVSNRNPISTRSLKRHPQGSVVVRHYGRDDIRFTRVTGGWLMDMTGEVVSSAAVAAEVNSSVGCKESWARVY